MGTFKRLSVFSQIPEQLAYPATCKATLSQAHSVIVEEVLKDLHRTRAFLKNVVQLMNTLTFRVISGDDLQWSAADPLNFDKLEDDFTIRCLLDSPQYHLYITFRDIHWASDNIEIVVDTPVQVPTEPAATQAVSAVPVITANIPTPKEDLYIKPPLVPRFSLTQLYVAGMLGDAQYCVYTSFPEIPKRQTDISATTDVSKMTSSDLLKLYPNHIIRTRSAAMYEPCEDLQLDPILGLILPIAGYTLEQLRENIIKYPHIYKLTRLVDNKLISFYTHIEIDGELHRVSDIWETLPEHKIIPYNSDFVKEYVVRRYLLERDVKGICHTYPVFGELDPFLTLFAPPETYESLGYSDAEQLARLCVESRVQYKLSRNPVMRRLKENA